MVGGWKSGRIEKNFNFPPFNLVGSEKVKEWKQWVWINLLILLKNDVQLKKKMKNPPKKSNHLIMSSLNKIKKLTHLFFKKIMYVQMDEGEKKNKATRRNEEEKKKKSN